MNENVDNSTITVGREAHGTTYLLPTCLLTYSEQVGFRESRPVAVKSEATSYS